MGEPQIQNGSDGEWVVYLQELLVQYGYDIGEEGVDGLFGPHTEEAVRQYQQNNVDAYGRQLVVDGIVGPKTWSSLTQATEIDGEDAPAGAGGDGGASLYYDESVSIVMQTTNNTCWAASCAMLLGSSEQEVIDRVGNAGGDGADEPEMNVISSQLSLQMPGGVCMGPDGWEAMLKSHGPIMVGIPGHYIVIGGINSEDGTTATTQFHVFDPARGEFWDTFDNVNSAYEIDASSGANLLTR
jgi:hypothetical protein